MNRSFFCLLYLMVTVLPALAGFEVTENHGRIEIRDNDKLVFGYQHQPLPKPKGGEIFAGSAFVHPLTTPSGFELTQIQPDDHLHHFGVWWPWKKIEVDGKSYITWEMQQHEGRHVAVSAKVSSQSADAIVIEAVNRSDIKPEGEDYQPVLNEQVTLRFSRMGKDAYLLDIDIVQQPLKEREVTIEKYRYSGFSWRGTAAWNNDNSTMRTSGGHHRDNANHQPANWVSVDGKTPAGMGTFLMMSAAPKTGGKAELLRVWGSNMEHGAPFANFNPVAKASIELKPSNSSVSRRSYRLVIADHAILPDEANKLWQEWQLK